MLLLTPRPMLLLMLLLMLPPMLLPRSSTVRRRLRPVPRASQIQAVASHLPQPFFVWLRTWQVPISENSGYGSDTACFTVLFLDRYS
jgi:hypothetical protein